MKEKNNKSKKLNFPTKIILDYLKETSKNLILGGIDLIIDPDKMIKNAGFYVRYPFITSLITRWSDNLDKVSSFERKNGKIYLTEKGRIKIIKNIIKEKFADEKWDKKWRAIIFDIPEINRRSRDFLRKELKWMGFKELQKSIWITPLNINKELFILLKLWKMDFGGDIKFLEINRIEDDKNIKKLFEL